MFVSRIGQRDTQPDFQNGFRVLVHFFNFSKVCYFWGKFSSAKVPPKIMAKRIGFLFVLLLSQPTLFQDTCIFLLLNGLKNLHNVTNILVTLTRPRLTLDWCFIPYSFHFFHAKCNCFCNFLPGATALISDVSNIKKEIVAIHEFQL